MKKLGMVGAVLALGARQEPLAWYKGGASESDYQKASYECERDTRMAAASFGGGIVGAANADSFAIRCMNTKGFYRVPVSQAAPVRPVMTTTGPPPPMRDASGATYSGGEMVLCKFPDNEPVKFSARTCSQGHGTILGPAT